jgi:hypothetical protein
MDKVNEVLARETWNEADVNILLAHQDYLPVTAKVRLGLVPAPAIKAVEVPVVEVPTLTMEPTPVIDTVVETPKKVKKGKR